MKNVLLHKHTGYRLGTLVLEYAWEQRISVVVETVVHSRTYLLPENIFFSTTLSQVMVIGMCSYM